MAVGLSWSKRGLSKPQLHLEHMVLLGMGDAILEHCLACDHRAASHVP